MGLLLGLISSIQPTFFLYTSGLSYINNVESRVVALVNEAYPDNLQIKIQNGTASTNVTEPYHITVSQNTLNNLFGIDGSKSNKADLKPQSRYRLLTLNTKGKVEDFELYQSMYMITAKNYVRNNDKGAVEISSLTRVPNVTITKSFILNKIQELKTKYKILDLSKIFIYTSPIVLSVLYLISFIISIFFETIIIYIISKALSMNLSFDRLFTLTGATYILPSLFFIILKYIPLLNSFGLWIETLVRVLVISAIYVFLNHYKNQTPQVQVQQ